MLVVPPSAVPAKGGQPAYGSAMPVVSPSAVPAKGGQPAYGSAMLVVPPSAVPAKGGQPAYGSAMLVVPPSAVPAKGGQPAYGSAMPMYCVVVYSAMPSAPPSRPRPDCLTPPNGAAAFEMTPALKPTMPNSICSATRNMRA